MAQTILHETFNTPDIDASLLWYNEPGKYRIDIEERVLVVETDPETDYWQKTHYGFSADNGHFLFLETEENFVLETRVSYAFKHSTIMPA